MPVTTGSIVKVKEEDKATTLVMEWLERENKPVTPQSLTDALGSRVAKAMVQRILERFYGNGKLCCKELKKIRFYYLNVVPNESFASAGATTTVIENLKSNCGNPREGVGDDQEEQRRALCAEIGQLWSKLTEGKKHLARLRQYPPVGERVKRMASAKKELHDLESEVRQMEDEAADAKKHHDSSKVSENYMPTDEASVRARIQNWKTTRRLWKERRDFTTLLIEAAVGDTCSAIEISERFGCVFDAEAGVSFDDTTFVLPPHLIDEAGR